MRRRWRRWRLHWLALRNCYRGYAWSSVQRCRTCAHTVYESDRVTRTTCRYCAPADEAKHYCAKCERIVDGETALIHQTCGTWVESAADYAPPADEAKP